MTVMSSGDPTYCKYFERQWTRKDRKEYLEQLKRDFEQTDVYKLIEEKKAIKELNDTLKEFFEILKKYL